MMLMFFLGSSFFSSRSSLIPRFWGFPLASSRPSTNRFLSKAGRTFWHCSRPSSGTRTFPKPLFHTSKHAKFGVHCRDASALPLVEQLLVQGSKAEISLNGVLHLYSVSNDKHVKLEQVCDRKKVAKLCVFCGGAETVELVASRLSGLTVQAHLSMENEVQAAQYKFSAACGRMLLITDLGTLRGQQDVVNFDVPTAQGYLNRAGKGRNEGSKMVLNLFSIHEVDLLQAIQDHWNIVMRPLPIGSWVSWFLN